MISSQAISFFFEPLVMATGYGCGRQNKDFVVITERVGELLSDQTDTDPLIGIH